MNIPTKKVIDGMFAAASRKFSAAAESDVAAIQDIADGLAKLVKAQQAAFTVVMVRLAALAAEKKK
jgi:hypothetical protein